MDYQFFKIPKGSMKAYIKYMEDHDIAYSLRECNFNVLLNTIEIEFMINKHYKPFNWKIDIDI